jgi:hypothetical protein
VARLKVTLEIYRRGGHALSKGIVADTKFEFGLAPRRRSREGQRRGCQRSDRIGAD